MLLNKNKETTLLCHRAKLNAQQSTCYALEMLLVHTEDSISAQ